MTNSAFIKVTRAISGNSISGKVTFAAKQGQIVQIKGSTTVGKPGVSDSNVELQLANGTRGFHLERDLIQGEVPLEMIAFNKDYLTPEILSPDGSGGYMGWASARQVQEVELEGSDLLDASITSGLALNTELSTKAGKVSVRGTVGVADELYGILRGYLAPAVAGNKRILVEVAQ
jgi:hypothetical protein